MTSAPIFVPPDVTESQLAVITAQVIEALGGD